VGQSYRDLIAWQKAMDFVMDVYRTSKGFPRDELYALASQLRRAAVRVPTNMAEGQGVFAANEFHYFLAQARGSLVEVGTQLMMAQNPTYFSPEHGKDRMDKAAELGKILNRLIGAIRPAA
jgi:four helix bundle protein